MWLSIWSYKFTILSHFMLCNHSGWQRFCSISFVLSVYLFFFSISPCMWYWVHCSIILFGVNVLNVMDTDILYDNELSRCRLPHLRWLEAGSPVWWVPTSHPAGLVDWAVLGVLGVNNNNRIYVVQYQQSVYLIDILRISHIITTDFFPFRKENKL